MANFVETFKKGKAGLNVGLTTGIRALDKAINGLQKKTSIGVAAAPKCGKTTVCDYAFLISPYLQMEQLGMLHNINWIYFSGEIDRVSKEFKVAAFFMAYDYGVYNFMYRGELIQMNSEYLMGKQLWFPKDNKEAMGTPIPILAEHEEMLKEIYTKRIIPMFGEFNAKGERIKKGKIDFIEDLENPTGMSKYVWKYARDHGKFLEEEYTTLDDHNNRIKKKRIVGYQENNPDLYTIIICDHIRKPKRERGFSMKENIDKWLEYTTYLRNTCSFTFINICHSNRGIANVERLRYAGEYIFPTADDIKDTGNLAEESTILMTLFNANDEKYNLEKHFGVELKDYPNYRSLHITESRYTESPAHIQMNMYGGINMFTPLNNFD
jgi:hypothetical protein